MAERSSKPDNLFEFYVGPSLHDEDEEPIQLLLTDGVAKALAEADSFAWRFVLKQVRIAQLLQG